MAITTVVNNLDMDAALYTQYRKYGSPTPDIKGFIPRAAHDLFDPHAAPFVPQCSLELLDPYATTFVPLAARGSLNPAAADFVPLLICTKATSEALPKQSQHWLQAFKSPIPSFARNLRYTHHIHAAAFSSSWTARTSDTDTHATVFQAASAVFTQSVPNQSCRNIYTKEYMFLQLGELLEEIEGLVDNTLRRSPRILSYPTTMSTKTKDSIESNPSNERTDAFPVEILLCEASQRQTVEIAEDTRDLSLVHHVDPISLARSNVPVAQASVCEDLVITIIFKKAQQVFQMIKTKLTVDDFALHRFEVLPALPLLIAILKMYGQLVEAFFLGTPANSDLSDSSVTQAHILDNEDMDSESKHSESVQEDSPKLQPSKKFVNPNESGFGPSFRQRSAELQFLLQSSDGSDRPATDMPLASIYHHQSYLGKPVLHKIATDPEVSLAIITGQPKGSMCPSNIEDYARMYATLNHAFLFIDPVILHGNFNELDMLSISKVREAVFGRTYRYYTPCGTWIVDEYDPEEPVYTDNHSIQFLPPVFGELNDLGYGYHENDPTSFRSRIGGSFCAETAANKARLNKSKEQASVNLPRLRSWSPKPSPLVKIQSAQPYTGANSALCDELLRPSQTWWADLDDDSETEVTYIKVIAETATSDADTEADEEVSEDEALSGVSSLHSQVLLLHVESFDAFPDDSSSAYSEYSDMEHTSTNIDAHSVSPNINDIATEGEHTSLGTFMYGAFSSVESLNDGVGGTTVAEVMLPVHATEVRRTISSPLPHDADKFATTTSSRSVSFPLQGTSGPSMQLPHRTKPAIPRSEGVWNLSSISAETFSSRSKAPLSPLALASVAEEEDDEVEDEAYLGDTEEDNDNVTPKSLSAINRAFRESIGIPEPGLLPLSEHYGFEDAIFPSKTPTTVARYRRRRSNIDVLPAIMSTPTDMIETEVCPAAPVSHTPPPPTPGMDSIEVASISDSSSISGEAEFGSSPPMTPTRVIRPASVTPSRFAGGDFMDGIETSVTPSQFAGNSILDGIPTSPIPAETVLDFSGIFTVASSEDLLLMNRIIETSTTESTDTESTIRIFMSPSSNGQEETCETSFNTAAVTGEFSITELPEVKKAWKLSKIQRILSKSKDERALLRKKMGRRVYANRSQATEVDLPPAINGNLRKEGWFGSIKSWMSRTIRRK